MPRPKVRFATFFGGIDVDAINDVQVDADGNVYVVGSTLSRDLPTVNAAQSSYGGGSCLFEDPCTDAFAAKLSPDGSSIVYSTYLGGDAHDAANSVAVDADGNAYVTGATASPNFPVTPGAVQEDLGGGEADVFVTKLGPTGSLEYSTFLGGPAAWDDTGFAIDVDVAGQAVVTGRAYSADFPTTPGAFRTSCTAEAGETTCSGIWDAFVSKLNPTGTDLVYSTFLGGEGREAGRAVEVDEEGNAYVAGEMSDDFPTTPGSFDPTPQDSFSDGFVTKLDPTGSRLVYSTALGGDFWDHPRGLAVDAAGAAYVVGQTRSPDFPTTEGSFDPVCNTRGDKTFDSCTQETDAFVTKLNPRGSSLEYSGYLEGVHWNSYEEARDVAVDDRGRAWVVGGTASDDFPLLRAVQPKAKLRACQSMDCYDAFITRVDRSGRSLDMSTFYGGQSHDIATSVALRGSSALVAGWTNSAGFPDVEARDPEMLSDKKCKERHPYGVVYRCSDGFLLEIRDRGNPRAHPRSVRLKLRRHLVARGRVIVSTGFDGCARNEVVVVYRSHYGFRPVGRARTDADGRFRVRIPHKQGGYFARLLGSTAAKRDACHAAHANWASHVHGTE